MCQQKLEYDFLVQLKMDNVCVLQLVYCRRRSLEMNLKMWLFELGSKLKWDSIT